MNLNRTRTVVLTLALALVWAGTGWAADAPPPAGAKALPKLLDLGATKCIPCKRMAPILDALKADFAGQLDVVFVDVWENPLAAKPYNIEAIPTQLFFAPDGKELWRHEGFLSREDILAKWKELGYNLAPQPPAGQEPRAPNPGHGDAP